MSTISARTSPARDTRYFELGTMFRGSTSKHSTTARFFHRTSQADSRISADREEELRSCGSLPCCRTCAVMCPRRFGTLQPFVSLCTSSSFSRPSPHDLIVTFSSRTTSLIWRIQACPSFTVCDHMTLCRCRILPGSGGDVESRRRLVF